MPIWKSDSDRLLRAFKTDVLAQVDGQLGQLRVFMHEGDWSSIIKLHALIESNVSQLVCAHIEDPRIHVVIDRLPLANEGTGKLAFTKSLDLLTGRQRGYVKRLSELRNTLVHDVNQTSFDLSAYVARLPPGEQRAWQDRVVCFEGTEEALVAWRETALVNPKLTLFVAAMMLIVDVTLKATRAKNRQELNRVALKTAEELFSGNARSTTLSDGGAA